MTRCQSPIHSFSNFIPRLFTSLLVTLLNTGNACVNLSISLWSPFLHFVFFILSSYFPAFTIVCSICMFQCNKYPNPATVCNLTSLQDRLQLSFMMQTFHWIAVCAKREVIFWHRINLCPRHSTNLPWNRQQLRNINLNLERKSTEPFRKQLSPSAFQRFRAKWMLHRYLWITSGLQIDIPASWGCPTQRLEPKLKDCKFVGPR